MLSREMLTFLKVAETGSFSKAAKEQFISTASVMKQINVLEDRIGCTLVRRSNKGVSLTQEGNIVYRTGKGMYREMEQMHIEINTAIPTKTIRIGTSLLNPANALVNIWNQAYPDDQEYRIKLIPYEDEHKHLMESILQLGSKYDFLLNIGESHSILSKASYLELGRQKLLIAVSRAHRLASRAQVTLADLEGETLIVKENDQNDFNQELRKAIQNTALDITVKQLPSFYDINTFNSIDETGDVLVILESWGKVHPFLKIIPVNWGFVPSDVSYGLLFSPKISEDANGFLDKLKKAMRDY